MNLHSESRGFELIVCNLPAWSDPAVPIAASRAGATGLLNLEETRDPAAARDALARFCRFGRGVRGIKLRSDNAIAAALLADLSADVTLVVLAGADSAAFPGAVVKARAGGRRVFAECASIEDARAALAAGVDGLVAKGHEAGGFVGEETTYILTQRLLADVTVPVWAYGGIGLHAAAACYAAGCAGVVLDVQFSLARESNVPSGLAAALERMEGDETVCLGNDLGCLCRMYRRPGMAAVEALQRLEPTLFATSPTSARAEWRTAIRERLGWDRADSQVWPLGQDATHAAKLARRFGSVAGIVGGFQNAIAEHVALARSQKALDRLSPMARAHGTEFPILQGPMTRVSDTAAFAEAVAQNGALPFLALALLKGPQVRRLLEETRERLGNRPWGVGILGFVPADLREEQVAVIDSVRPPFAIIAGGRPDQARRLDAHGITTYLHVPAPGLLKAFLEDGARRFIFEGRECGGHVGPRTSFVLWEAMIDTLLDAIDGGVPARELHVVFAGGVHDARSAAMAAIMAAPLVERGVAIGVLLGTAYLFTEEAVAGNAIVENFQREAVDCRSTVLLESGPGHSTRCIPTPFYQTFKDTKRRLFAEGRSSEDIRAELENLNLGRLRIASKGVVRDPAPAASDAKRYLNVDGDRQHQDGMYMIGQLAALRGSICRMADLHHSISVGSSTLLAGLPALLRPRPARLPAAKPCDIAVIGLGCILPKAPNVETFWANVLNKVDAITEVPKDRFDIEQFFDADRNARDKVYSRWGGFLDDVPFDPMRYGIPPAALPSIDSLQLLSLEAARAALADAGYLDGGSYRDRTSVILGLSGGLGELGLNYGIRSNLPMFVEPTSDMLQRLPEWTEDSFAGILLNVAAGRIANRFDLGGVNYTVDAACASSLAAVYLAVTELEHQTSDMVLVGGVDTVQSPFGFLCFSKAQALSPRGRCRTFDATADGIAISEGLSMLVLKRLADAERDGDRIYAVIKSVGGSSDGRGRSLTAPRPEGQTLALDRAYSRAGISPATVGLIEAHGTGTVAGDAAEVAALSEVFQQAGSGPASCAIGSVKSMIGHTKSAAGVTGLLKVALALHHKVLPPTLHCDTPNPKLREADNPFFVNTEPLPWIPVDAETPRRAGVSSFGFGGTNFHAVLEEYRDDYAPPRTRKITRDWPAELFVWQGRSATDVASALGMVLKSVEEGATPALRSLAASVWRANVHARVDAATVRVAIIAADLLDLAAKMRTAIDAVQSGAPLHDAKGIYVRQGKDRPQLAFLFPGQGSQSPHMLRDLALNFPYLRESCALADEVLRDKLPQPLSRYIYPPAAFSSDERAAQMQALTDTAVAQPALGAVEFGLSRLLNDLGVEPDMVAGHSYGEYVALAVAGAITQHGLLEISEARGRAIADAVKNAPGAMAAVSAPADRVRELLANSTDVWVANLNGPRQTIISGSAASVNAAVALFEQSGIGARLIPVSCAFHTPLMAGAGETLQRRLAELPMSDPRVPVFSNSTARPYPGEVAAMRQLLGRHLVEPVNFVAEIQAMYDAGARIFVEVGPRNVLSGLTRQILNAPDVDVVSLDASDRSGVVQLLHAVGQLAVAGVNPRIDMLFEGRNPDTLDLNKLVVASKREPGWLVNGAGARPVDRARAKIAPMSPSRPAAPAITNVSTPVVPAVASPAPMAAPAAAPAVGVAPVSAVLPASAPSSAPITGAADGVMLQYQTLMSQFLQTQTAIMTAFLSGQPVEGAAAIPPMVAPASGLPLSVPAPVPPAVLPAPMSAAAATATVADVAPVAPAAAERDFVAELLQLVSERTGYPTDMLDPDVNIEADLGIDSIKRVEILSAFQRKCAPVEQGRLRAVMDRLTASKSLREMGTVLAGVLSGHAGAAAGGVTAAPATSAAPESNEAPQPRDPLAELIALVCERTGYPADMLDPDANVEADLGIDSIKRVEILSAYQRTCSAADQRALQSVMDQLTSRRTLRELAGRIAEVVAVQGARDRESVAPAAAPARAPAVEPRREALDELIELVSERTGYPADMLDPDVNIEADLGIDSIKRVEILSAFQRRRAAHEQRALQAVMDQLTSRRTLRELAARITEALVAPAGAAVESPAQPAAVPQPVAEALEEVPRLRLKAVAIPLVAAGDRTVVPGRLWIITDDETGIAGAVAASLTAIGERPVVVRHVPGAAGVAAGRAADLTNAQQVGDLVQSIRRELGPPSALLHLLPLAPCPDIHDMSVEEWRARVDVDNKALYLLVHAAGTDLNGAGESGGATVFAATTQAPSLVDGRAEGSPTQGGIASFLKTVAIEMAAVRCRAVHLDAADGRGRIADHVVAEIGAVDGPIECAYSGGKRFALQPRVAPLEPAAKPGLDGHAVFLITGGARGITAEIALNFAQAIKPTLIIVGRSPRPQAEPKETAGVEDAQQLRQVITALLKSGGKIRPSDVEARLLRLQHDREIERNITAAERAGATVKYVAMDVRDVESFGTLIDTIYSTYGRLDVVIHGAGIIEDKLVKDKTPESFDRVVRTKTDSSFTLVRKLRPQSLKALIFMSSVTATFGNRGQADYGTANGVINALATLVSRRWSTRVRALNWGPWDKTGMVSPDVKRQFATLGIQVIPLDAGVAAAVNEVLGGEDRCDPVVVLGDGPWHGEAIASEQMEVTA